MNPLSEEQKEILNEVKKGKNVVVDAVAGTGKTTLILGIAKELSDQKILQVTYNAALRKDVEQRVQENELANLKIHTFHSLAKQYYLDVGYTDKEIRKALSQNVEPKGKITPIDLLVIDECQDMTYLYFQLILKYLKDMGSKVQIMILGDYKQGLYEFKGADTRFLTMGSKIWKHSDLLKTNETVDMTMKMSFRITDQMRHFVNQVMLGEERMNSCREGPQVQYIRNSYSNMMNVVKFEINRLLSEGAKPSDIFVLASSIKSTNMNICRLENALVEKGLPCYVPILKDEKLDERVIDGKIVFSTFHSAKGRQRKYVFITGFDNGYFKFFDRNITRDECPNTLYVAATRATNTLFLLEGTVDKPNRPLEFLKINHSQMKKQEYMRFRGYPQGIFFDKEEEDNLKKNIRRLTPTELTKFISEEVMDIISPMIDKMFVKEEYHFDDIEIPTIVQMKSGFYEEVSDLNGIAIPCMYYDHLRYKINEGLEETAIKQGEILLENIKLELEEKKNIPELLRELICDLPEEIETIEDYLYLCNVNVSLSENLLFKLKQIERDEYNWLDESVINKCKERLDIVLKDELDDYVPEAEISIVDDSMEHLNEKIDNILKDRIEYSIPIRFSGRVDMITKNTLWELKCTSETVIEHYVQLILYAWIWSLRYEDSDTIEEDKEFRLFNIKTGDVYKLNATIEEMSEVVIALLKGKYVEYEKKTDEYFYGRCLEEIERYNMDIEDKKDVYNRNQALFDSIIDED